MEAQYIFLAAGALFGMTLPVYLARRLAGLSEGRVLAAVLLGGVGAYLGGRLQCVLLHGDTGRLLGGVHAVGMILGSWLAYPLACRLLRIPTLRILDLLAIGIGGAIALCRVGCWINDCCAPIQPHYVAFGVALSAAATLWYPRRRYDGEVIALTALAYSVGATIIEGQRRPTGYWNGYPDLQVAAFVMAGMAAAVVVALEIRSTFGFRMFRHREVNR